MAREIVPPLAFKSLWRLKQRLRGNPVEWEVLPGGFERARGAAKIVGVRDAVTYRGFLLRPRDE